jgi:N-acetylmuramoyl-L-alanine amidase
MARKSLKIQGYLRTHHPPIRCFEKLKRMRQIPLKHFTERSAKIELLVLHSTAYNLQQALKIYDEQAVAPHYIIDFNGEIIQCVAEQYRAKHAGRPDAPQFWRGIDTDLNSHSIGIEILNPTLGQSEFEEAQILATISLCQKIIAKYEIQPQNVIGHSDLTPTCKPDPGHCFPWQRLAQNNIGLWFEINQRLDGGSSFSEIKRFLKLIGYDTRSAEIIKASSYAFCRHFLPQFVTQVQDIEQLLTKVYPDNCSFMQDEVFIKTLQAVAWSSLNHCNSTSTLTSP